MSFCLTNEDIKNSDILGDKLMDLAGIVFRKHFYASYNEREDLISVGVLKALSLIAGGNFDQDKGTILNFLYTGMRNEMHNYLYHRNKKIKGIDVTSEIVNDVYFEDECFEIEMHIVEDVCIEFGFYGNLVEDVTEEIRKRGFQVMGSENFKGSFTRSNIGSNKFRFCNKFKEDLIDRICGAVIWKKQEYLL